MPRRSSKADPPAGLLVLVFLLSILAFVSLTDSWGLLGIAPGGKLQFFGNGGARHRALTPTTNVFGSRVFRVREGDVVTVNYELAGSFKVRIPAPAAATSTSRSRITLAPSICPGRRTKSA